MTSHEDFKKQLLEAEIAASQPQNEYHDATRKIVNIERQCFYGQESERKRLEKIREVISMAVNKKDF